MAQRSWRSSASVWLTAAIVAVACTQAFAHRRDEYLQAVRIAIEPTRVDVELDLTPGIAIAPDVVGSIDRDRDGSIGTAEAGAYAARVLGEMQLDVDGRPMPLELIDHRFPAVASMFKGEGTIHIRLSAAVPPLPAGSRRVRYRSDHRPDIAAYLANALAPASERIAVKAQRRSVDQRDIVIEYLLDGQAALERTWWFVLGLVGVLLMGAAINGVGPNFRRKLGPTPFFSGRSRNSPGPRRLKTQLH